MALLQILVSPAGLAFDRQLVRWTGHSLLNRLFARQAGFAPQPALLLETLGRRSGARRQAALPYFRIDGKLLIVGSKGGMPTDPAWVTNLRAEPAVRVWIARKPMNARARVSSGEERAALWAELPPRCGRSCSHACPPMRTTSRSPRGRFPRWCSSPPEDAPCCTR